jgi:RNA polymerase sigma-70 factor, ECF subfamily
VDDSTGLTVGSVRDGVQPGAAADQDRRLVDLAQHGDVRAFEALVRRYQRWVFTLVLRMAGDRADAEDLAQEVFLKAYRGLSSFRGGSRFSTWLYAIASHHCLNHLASRGYRTRRETRSDAQTDASGRVLPAGVERVADEAPGPDAALEQRDLRRAIEDALAHMTADHRMAVVLRDIQGLSYEEIADTLGVELGTVRSRLHRARMELKARLAPVLSDGSER